MSKNTKPSDQVEEIADVQDPEIVAPEADAVQLDGLEQAPINLGSPEQDVLLKDANAVDYIGGADVKVLSIEDLHSVGIEEPKGDLIWNAENNKRQFSGKFNAETLKYLAAQEDFRVVGHNE